MYTIKDIKQPLYYFQFFNYIRKLMEKPKDILNIFKITYFHKSFKLLKHNFGKVTPLNNRNPN